VKGIKFEFDETGNFTGITAVTPRFTAFSGDYAPRSGAVNVELYPID
jgi:hypothetical protein